MVFNMLLGQSWSNEIQIFENLVYLHENAQAYSNQTAQVIGRFQSKLDIYKLVLFKNKLIKYI